MNRQEALGFLKTVLDHDLNDDLHATALGTIISVVIEQVRTIEVGPEEGWFSQKRSKVIEALQNVSRQEVTEAVNAERANRNRKTHEKYVTALNTYKQAVAAIEKQLNDLIAAMEQLVGQHS